MEIVPSSGGDTLFCGSVNDEINVHTARLIREAGLTTWLPANGDISSGGVDMFAAGAERVFESGGYVGVHSWGAPGTDVVAAELPRDDPAHRSQLEYFSEMLGDTDGPEFYFYTLNAAPFEAIHRMTPEEIDAFGLTTRVADTSIPASVAGSPSGYLSNTAVGGDLKLSVQTCASAGSDDVVASLFSDDLGELQLTVVDGRGELVFVEFADLLDPADVTGVGLVDGQVSGTAGVDWAALGLDTDEPTQLTLTCNP